jgi:hypothetical protein
MIAHGLVPHGIGNIVSAGDAGQVDERRDCHLGRDIDQGDMGHDIVQRIEVVEGINRQRDRGQVNDWRDPVTNPKLWVLGTGVALIGGGALGVLLTPSTGGGSLYAYGSVLMGGGLGGGLGGGSIVYGINNYHALDKYLTKPQTQSIMFDWKAKQSK